MNSFYTKCLNTSSFNLRGFHPNTTVKSIHLFNIFIIEYINAKVFFGVFLLLNKEQSQFDSNRSQRKHFQIFHDILKNLLIDLY